MPDEHWNLIYHINFHIPDVTKHVALIFDVIMSIKSMDCMYEKVSRYLAAYPVTLLLIPLPYCVSRYLMLHVVVSIET